MASKEIEGLPQPPEMYIRNTGDEEEIAQRTEEFFNGVLDFLGYNQKAREVFMKCMSIELQRRDEKGEILESDDRLTLLIARDVVIASVLDRRNERNFHQVYSACYLNPELVGRIEMGL